MSTTMSATIALSKGRSKYPHSGASLGPKIRVVNHKDCWWEATGPALQEFRVLVPELRSALDGYCETIASGWITFSVYMIGRSDESAAPTIMFFSTQKKARENAMHATKKSGILKRHPGFKVGHRALPPDVDSLVQPAGGGQSLSEFSDTNLRRVKITYDSRSRIRYVGTEIFVEQAHGAWRQATANAVYNGRDMFFLTVAHVFPEQPVDDYDSDYEIAGDTDDEDPGEDDANVTSQGSLTSQDDDGDEPKAQPFTTTNLPHSRHRPSRPRSKSRSRSRSPFGTGDRPAPPATEPRSKSTQESNQLKPASRIPRVEVLLQDFGTLMQLSHNKDWALIATDVDMPITPGLGHGSSNRIGSKSIRRIMIGSPEYTNAPSTIRTVHGELKGKMHETPLYTKLPNSTQFEEVYKMKISRSEGLLQMGDCGAGVFRAEDDYLLGFVVAASLTDGVAYIMPAGPVFKDIEEALGLRIFALFDIIQMYAQDTDKADATGSRQKVEELKSIKTKFKKEVTPEEELERLERRLRLWGT